MTRSWRLICEFSYCTSFSEESKHWNWKAASSLVISKEFGGAKIMYDDSYNYIVSICFRYYAINIALLGGNVFNWIPMSHTLNCQHLSLVLCHKHSTVWWRCVLYFAAWYSLQLLWYLYYFPWARAPHSILLPLAYMTHIHYRRRNKYTFRIQKYF